MVVEVELINGQFFCEGGLAPSQENGVVPALLQFDVSQEIEGRDHIEIFLRGLRQGGVEVLEHAFETEVRELVLEALRVRHDLFLFMTKASYSAREGSSSRMWLRWGCLSLTGGCCRLGRHLLVENVFDIVGAVRLMQGGPLHGVKEGVSAIVIFERQEFLDALFQGLVGGGQVFEIALGDLA